VIIATSFENFITYIPLYFTFIKSGKNVEIAGTNVMNISTIMAATINGSTPLDMPIIFVLDIPAAT